jgi:macrolide transport system ATP-binding/permease protein
MAIIEIRNLKKTYLMGDTVVPALRGVTLQIEAGEFVAIMGPSGSGKSTLMHVLGLLDAPESGSYRLLGEEVAALPEDELAERRRRTIGFVFQQFNLLSRTSALENVALPLIYSGGTDRVEWPKTLLNEVGLGGRIGHKPNELSGGQQQRVAIARSLVNRPRILFADEPTGNLDSKSQDEIMHIFRKLNESGITIILVTHEEEIARYARRVIRMRDGLVQSDERAETAGRTGAAAVAERTAAPPQVRTAPSAHALADEFLEHFKQAWRALSSNKIRTGLSMLGILIGVGAVIAMLALGKGAQESLNKQLASMGSNLLILRPGSAKTGPVALQAGDVTRFTLADAESIRAEVAGVSRIAPSVTGRGQLVYGNKNWNTQVQGTTPDYAPMKAAVPVLGRFFTDAEDRQRARVAVLGLTVVRELFGGQSPLGEMIKINKVSFQVIGVLPEKGATGFRDQDDIVVVPLQTAMRRLLGKEFADSIDVEMASPEALESGQEQIGAVIMKNHRLPPSKKDTFQIRNMADIQAALSETNKTMAFLLGSIALVSLLVGGIGIMNIMLVSVTERTREIGLRKALGARKNDILSQFLIEAVVVSVAGGLLGVLLGGGVSLLLSSFAGWTTSVSPESVLVAVGFSLAVGVGFGLWPARKAAALNPIEALRYE